MPNFQNLRTQEVQEQLIRDYFPHIINLREQVQLVYWSNFHFISKNLLDLLPFGWLLGGRRFYSYVNYQLGPIKDKARRNLLYWTLGDVRRFDGQPANQITLSYDETFFWHYVVPPWHQEIVTQLICGNRIRFLSHFHLLQEKVEVEFSEIRAISGSGADYQLVCTDSKEYIWRFADQIWETNIVNQEFNLVNPWTFNLPISEPNNLGREEAYQECLRILSEITDDLKPHKWASTAGTQVGTTSLPPSSPACTTHASTPESEYIRSRNYSFPADFSLDLICYCGIDVCHCENRHRPGTPPTPPNVFLWDPTQRTHPIPGLHYNHAG